jgi:NTP pyrophosphatase (non-canonical NTP hydrolase)
MGIEKIDKWVIDFCEREGWEFSPVDDLTKSVEELGEVAREIRRYKEGRQRPDEDNNLDKDVIVKDLGSEIGDVLFTLVKISNYYGLTLEECFELHKFKMEERYSKGKLL